MFNFFKRYFLKRNLSLERVSEFAILPKRAHYGDSGLDIYSAEDLIIYPSETIAVGTGWKMSVPLGYEIQIRPRSGLALKHKITVSNTPGTVDFSFRGEVKIILRNEGTLPFEIKKGDRIAQMVVSRVELWEPKEISELDQTTRGVKGFGSTGER